jgi:Uma2 family endonuclease
MEVPRMERAVAEAATKLSYDDLLLLPEDGKRHELIGGEHFVSPSPNVQHQRVLGRLYTWLSRHVEAHRLGEVFFAPLDVLFSRHDVVEPDLIFVSNERAEILTEANLQGAPDLLVEVLSPSSHRHDEVRKRALYDRAGVDEYWIVDPEAETVKVFRREGARYTRPLLLSRLDDDVLASPRLPGLEVSLAALFG